MDTDAITLRSFLTAGDSTFTVTSVKSGTRYTYRVAEGNPSGRTAAERQYFVSVLTGPDNRDNYSYAGMLFDAAGTLKPVQTKGSKLPALAPSWMGFVWLVHRINAMQDLGASAEFDPMGKCGRCRRPLTDPESIRTGLGPICREKL